MLDDNTLIGGHAWKEVRGMIMDSDVNDYGFFYKLSTEEKDIARALRAA